MVIWGVIFGAVLGLLWRGGDWSDHIVLGAMIGGLFGLSLRRSIRSEVRKALAEHQPLARAAEPVPMPAPIPAQPPQPPQAMRAPEVREAPPIAQAPPIPQASPVAAPPRPRPAPAPQQPDIVTVLVQRARDWLLGGNTVVRVGVLVLFVGLAFLAKYAIDNALLPPELRLAAIGIAAIALFVTGFRLRMREGVHRGYALTLQGAGVAVLYLTVFAAFRVYGLLPAGAAFAALALVCAFSAVIAVAQDAVALAFVGFAGGFAAPILVSTGQGSHVGLFSYYLLLGVAIAALSWVKAWRALNLLGFSATFVIATAWGVTRYHPQDFATIEPFLIAFFAVYLVAALAYSLRHTHPGMRAIDATLVFGVPLVAFGLQCGLVKDIEYAAAFSSLALGALYLALAAWLLRTKRSGNGDARVRQWLAECFFALGLGFATLAVPLALDARWTSAAWAVEGAAVFWMGRRQARWLARIAGLALQVLAAIAFLEGQAWLLPTNWPLAHPAFMGATLLAAAAFFIAWVTRTEPPGERAGVDARLVPIESALSPVFFWIAFLWWQFALGSEADRYVAATHAAAYDLASRIHIRLFGWVASAFALHMLALPERRAPWPVAATPAWTVLPVLIAGAIVSMTQMNHVFESAGWAVWPAVLVLHFTMLKHLDARAPQDWWPWVHAGGVWLAVLLAGNLLVYAVGRAHLWQTAWASVILLAAGTAVLLALSHARWWRPHRRWPLDRFARDYLWRAAAPLAVGVAAGSLVVAVHSDGNAHPLPYVPLLNPTDLAVALGLGACAIWLMRLRASAIAVAAIARERAPLVALGAIAFIGVNTVWLRVAHHFAGVSWDARSLFASFVVQAGYSILWTLIAVALMVIAQRHARRAVWTVGAALIGITVAKLFLIDLSNRGGSERIITFIAVGVLLLVVGYFAPMPPAERKPSLQGAAQ